MQSMSPPRSSVACQRCHRRKKKCDRAQPRCKACEDANAPCSFFEQETEVTLFNVAYVRDLEKRVSTYELQLKEALDSSTGHATSPPVPNGAYNNSSVEVIGFEAEPSSSWPPSTATREHSFSSTTSPSPHRRISDEEQMSFGKPGRENQLASELENLSLKATAEAPFLGYSSGVSFARLTQVVLQRLRPDQYSFSTEEQGEPEPSNNKPWQAQIVPARYQAPFRRHLNTPLPSHDQARRLVDFYWSHTHTLYPFIRKAAFQNAMSQIYTNNDYLAQQSPSVSYQIWMILAIGSTTLSSICVGEDNQSVAYFEKAMTYFEGALMEGSIVAIESLMLQVIYSFFNQVGPNTWHLIGAALRIAIGIGLHAKPVKPLPVDVQERRRRLFWSLFMMDRLVSIALGRPFGIREEDIEIEPFADVDDENILRDKILPQSPFKLSEMAVPVHILALRRIAGEIFERVYANPQRGLSALEKNELLSKIHDKLLNWRRSMPFPLRESQVSPVPHLTTAWYDMNYYNHVIMLYRPSPLCPVLELEKVHFIADASARAIRQTSNMHHQVKFAFNWLNLFTLFTAILTLMYSISAQPDPLPTFLERSGALADLDLAIELLETFGRSLPSALKCRNMVRNVKELLRRQISREDGPIRSSGPVAGSTETEALSGTSYPLFATWNQQYDALISRIKGDSFEPAGREKQDGIPVNYEEFQDWSEFMGATGVVGSQRFPTPLQMIFAPEDIGTRVSGQYPMDTDDGSMIFGGM